VDTERTDEDGLYLVHRFEEKPLVRDFIANTLMGIEFLWGGSVKLETSEVVRTPTLHGVYAAGATPPAPSDEPEAGDVQWQRVLYTMENRKLSRRILYAMDEAA